MNLRKIGAKALVFTVLAFACATYGYAQSTDGFSEGDSTSKLEKNMSSDATSLATNKASTANEPLVVEYKTTKEINKVIGFDPLYMPRFFGYDISGMYVIDGKIADLHFKSRLDDGMLTVRSASRKEVALDDISGLLGVNWEEKKILNTTLFLAKTTDGLEVIRWTTNRYSFVAAFRDLDEKALFNSLKGLIRITERHYSR